MCSAILSSNKGGVILEGTDGPYWPLFKRSLAAVLLASGERLGASKEILVGGTLVVNSSSDLLVAGSVLISPYTNIPMSTGFSMHCLGYLMESKAPTSMDWLPSVKRRAAPLALRNVEREASLDGRDCGLDSDEVHAEHVGNSFAKDTVVVDEEGSC